MFTTFTLGGDKNEKSKLTLLEKNANTKQTMGTNYYQLTIIQKKW